MRALGVVTVAGLTVAVIAEGAFLTRTQRRIETLEKQLESISTAGPRFADDEGDQPVNRRGGGFRGRPDDGQGRSLPPPRFEVPRPTGARLPPPQFQNPASNDPLPMPPGLDTPEAREQLRQFMLAQLERQKQEEREKQQQKRDEAQKQFRDTIAKNLKLSPAETDKFNQIVDSVESGRRTLREKMEAGQVPRSDAGKEMTAMRDRTEQQMKDLLGNERMGQFTQMAHDNPEIGGRLGVGFRPQRGPTQGQGGPPGPGGQWQGRRGGGQGQPGQGQPGQAPPAPAPAPAPQ